MSTNKQRRAARRAAEAHRRGSLRRLREKAPWLLLVLVIAFVLWLVVDYTSASGRP